MRPKNFLERRKKMLAFAGFYLASILLLFFIFSAFREETPAGERPILLREETAPALKPEAVAAQKEARIVALQNELKAAQNKIAALMIAGPTAAAENRQPLNPSAALLEKEARIATLENELRAAQNTWRSDMAAGSRTAALVKENESLKASLAQEETAANDLKEIIRGLKAGNEALSARLSEHSRLQDAAATPAEATNNALKSRAAELEDRLKSMDAELYFTKVDCNLSRADAKQIIYTSRQRKDLLTESLSILNNLLSSGDPSVRKKAKDRILQLNQIANTLRD